MADLVSQLGGTFTARWQERTGGRGKRSTYYKALLDSLDELSPGVPFPTGREGRELLTGRVDVRSPSSLYRALGNDGDLALEQRFSPLLPAKGDIVEKLVVETKIITYWPYRTGWLRGLRQTNPDKARFAATTMIQVVAEWAAANPRLAAERECAPPLAAAEDLCTIVDGPLALEEAAKLLASAVRYATGPSAATSPETVDLVYDDLMRLGFERSEQIDAAVRRLIEPLAEVQYLINRVPTQARRPLKDLLAPHFTAIMRLVEETPGG